MTAGTRESREENHSDVDEALFVSHDLCQLQAVDLGHRLVDDGEVEGLSAQNRGPQLGQRLPTIAGRVDPMTPSAQPLGEHFAGRSVVFDDEDLSGNHGRESGVRFLAALCLMCQRYREPEDRPYVHLALDTDLAVHQLDQLLRDRQTEPGSTKLSRRRAIGLMERFENAVTSARLETDPGVVDFESHIVHSREVSVADTLTPTSPSWVNLIALPIRLARIWLIRVGSPSIRLGTSSATEQCSSRPFE